MEQEKYLLTLSWVSLSGPGAPASEPTAVEELGLTSPKPRSSETNSKAPTNHKAPQDNTTYF
jgi:hypothetical protein